MDEQEIVPGKMFFEGFQRVLNRTLNTPRPTYAYYPEVNPVPMIPDPVIKELLGIDQPIIVEEKK